MADGMAAATAEDIVRDAMAPDLSPAAQQAWLDDALACFRRHGVIVIRNAIPPAAIAAVLAEFRVRHDVHMQPGQRKLFRSFQSDPLRAQVPTAVDGPIANPEVFAPASVMLLVRKLVGEDFIVGDMGTVISHPGAGSQEIHRDSSPLFGGLEMDLDLPPFSLTMLAPLVDVTPQMGPTEYWLGSHRIRDQAVGAAGPPLQASLSAGSVTLHDSRLLHRGGANVSGPVRPALYFGYHRKWHVDDDGFQYKPQVRITPAMLLRLPEQHRRLFAWALHLNRTDSLSDFVYRWKDRLRKRVMA